MNLPGEEKQNRHSGWRMGLEATETEGIRMGRIEGESTEKDN